MATKKELVQELIDNGVDSTEQELSKMTNKQLEKLIAENSAEEVQSSPHNDMMLQMQQQMQQMMEQMNALQDRNKELESEKEKAEEKMATLNEVEPIRKVTKVDKDRLIPVMNITAHSLIYQSKRSGAEWNWGEYGDIEYIEMQELLTMRSGQRKFLNEPFVLIMDNEAVSYLGLEKMYDQMIEPDNIDKVFKMKLADFKEVINTAPRGIQILIVNRAKQLIDKGEFDSMTKINFINDKFDTDLGM